MRYHQTPPTYAEAGFLVVRSAYVVDEPPPRNPIERPDYSSKTDDEWKPLKASEVAWKDRTPGQWLSETPLAVAADAIGSPTFHKYFWLFELSAISASMLDERDAPFAARLLGYSAPAAVLALKERAFD